MMKIGLLALLLAATPVLAEERHHAGASAEGEIRKIDKEAKKITIKHGEIKSLDMPAMTMVFQVKDVALLEQVKVGDKVRFSADKAGGAYTVTSIEKSQ